MACLRNNLQYFLLFSSALQVPVTAMNSYIREHLDAAKGLINENPKDDLLKGVAWPEHFPLTEHELRRQDESEDGKFYSQPRFVTHIDDRAIDAIKKYYASSFRPGAAVLDICSSWISHFPEDFAPNRAVGLGLNAEELAANKQLTEWKQHDLNQNPVLPFGDNEFDFVVNVVSVDYLIHPKEIFKEIYRVLKPGGLAIMSFSNRFFPTKAISIWFDIRPVERCQVVSWYYKFSGFTDIVARDITNGPSRDTDPMHVVQGQKPIAASTEL
eukprot:TRINITY_DN19272_c4_g1_i1.p1 TRINITY_DN19272_c4_g1~~TRINITY_DN19272_c4_g1_i1.p1  ORF type:complete len:294 (-),score=36.86 TRINITY_DN19272_c4_g1_i1:66-875(-)